MYDYEAYSSKRRGARSTSPIYVLVAESSSKRSFVWCESRGKHETLGVAAILCRGTWICYPTHIWPLHEAPFCSDIISW